MRQVRIRKGMIGLVFKNGDYEKFLESGKYWLTMRQTVKSYSLFHEFTAPIELDLLLSDKNFAKRVSVIDVKENQIGLKYEKGLLSDVLRAGQYAFWNDHASYELKLVDLSSTEEITAIDANLFQRPFLMPFIRLFIIEPFEKGLLFVNGSYVREIGPGTHRFWKNATTIEVQKVDMRQLQLEVAGQEILTKDKAALRINFYVHYKVVDIKKALIENKKFTDQLYILMQLALREFIGTLTLDELLEKKDEIGTYILSYFEVKATELGVELKSAGIRDVILPGDIKEIMNQVLVAQKRAQANSITRREETASTRSLLNTAKLMEDNAMLFKLKEMEYVEKISEKIGEITVDGKHNAVEQLKAIFSPDR
jgi:hypothetical protein